MRLPANAFPQGFPNYGRNSEIISAFTIENGEIVDNFFRDAKGLIHTKIGLKNGQPLMVDCHGCEWLSQSFFRNQQALYGFSFIQKSNSVKMYFTLVKSHVDFDSFTPIGKYYARDKNQFYFGPNGKTINETALTLFHDDTYKREALGGSYQGQDRAGLSLWESQMALANDKVYWKGKLLKDVHASVKRIAPNYFADDFNVYAYDKQKIKKIEGVDRASLLWMNYTRPNSRLIKTLITDKHQALYRYIDDSKAPLASDVERFRPLFEKHQGKLNQDYWWHKVNAR